MRGTENHSDKGCRGTHLAIPWTNISLFYCTLSLTSSNIIRPAVQRIAIVAVKGRKPSMFCATQGCPAAPPELPPCPYAQLHSARNSVSSQGSCPAPKPFIINNSLRYDDKSKKSKAFSLIRF